MVVLGMDTATQVLAVGVGSEAGVLGSAAYLIPRGHSRLLQPTLASVLKTSGLTVKDVTGVAVGMGPGSYTGVRLGVTTAKAMALTLGVPLIPVSTLGVMAQAVLPAPARRTTLVVPLIYARRQRAFGMICAKDGDDWSTHTVQQVLPVSAWMQIVERAQAQVNGDCAVCLVHDFTPRYDVLHLLDVPFVQVTALLEHVAGGMGAALIRRAIVTGADAIEGAEIHRVVPDYGLQVEAEVKLAERSSGLHGDG